MRHDRKLSLPLSTHPHRTRELARRLTFNKGRRGSKLLAKHCRNTAMNAKLEQMANMADSSALGVANRCGHPACIFVREPAVRVDSRLTLPKLHLTTFKSEFEKVVFEEAINLAHEYFS